MTIRLVCRLRQYGLRHAVGLLKSGKRTRGGVRGRAQCRLRQRAEPWAAPSRAMPALSRRTPRRPLSSSPSSRKWRPACWACSAR